MFFQRCNFKVEGIGERTCITDRTYGKDGVKEDGTIILQGVDYSKLVPILVKAIQELELIFISPFLTLI